MDQSTCVLPVDYIHPVGLEDKLHWCYGKKNCGILHHREHVLIACFLKIKLIIHVNESGLTRQFQTPLNSSKLPVDEILQITKTQ